LVLQVRSKGGQISSACCSEKSGQIAQVLNGVTQRNTPRQDLAGIGRSDFELG
jgi:hypothetical protein